MPLKEPEKLYYSIGEVSRIAELPASVLRFWETEFTELRPPKNRAGKRTYRRPDIDRILSIKKLLYEDGFTIAGARKALKGARAAGATAAPDKKMSATEIRRRLREILDILTE